MQTNALTFTADELDRLKQIYEASERHRLNWVLAVSVFPAATEGERKWKERTLAGIRLVEGMISKDAQKGKAQSGDIHDTAERILVVDDEEAMREMLESFLENEGYRVDTADGVGAAMGAIESKGYRLMLIDKNMPGTDGKREGGIDLLRYVRSKFLSSTVIMMTGYPTDEAAAEALQLGAVEFVHKPFSLEDLRRKIKKFMEWQG